MQSGSFQQIDLRGALLVRCPVCQGQKSISSGNALTGLAGYVYDTRQKCPCCDGEGKVFTTPTGAIFSYKMHAQDAAINGYILDNS